MSYWVAMSTTYSVHVPILPFLLGEFALEARPSVRLSRAVVGSAPSPLISPLSVTAPQPCP